jgi:hypothetical protein
MAMHNVPDELCLRVNSDCSVVARAYTTGESDDGVNKLFIALAVAHQHLQWTIIKVA